MKRSEMKAIVHYHRDDDCEDKENCDPVRPVAEREKEYERKWWLFVPMLIVAKVLTVGMRGWLACRLFVRRHIQPYAQHFRCQLSKKEYPKLPTHLAIYCGSTFEEPVDVALIRKIVSQVPGIEFVTVVANQAPTTSDQAGLRIDIVGLDGCERLRSAIQQINERHGEVTVEALREAVCPGLPPYDLMIVLNDRLVIRGALPLQVAFCEFFHQPVPNSARAVNREWRLRAIVHASLRQYSRCRQNFGR